MHQRRPRQTAFSSKSTTPMAPRHCQAYGAQAVLPLIHVLRYPLHVRFYDLYFLTAEHH